MVQPTVLKFTVGTNVEQRTLWPIFRDICNIAFIDFIDNATSGFVRVYSHEDGQALISALHEKKQIGGTNITLVFLSEEEDFEYKEKITAQKINSHQEKNSLNKKKKIFYQNRKITTYYF